MLKARMEKEAKMMLSPEEYNLLAKKFPPQSTLQINHYYLADQQYVLRIREFPKENRYLFTLKIKVEGGHQEYESSIPSHTFDHPFIQEIIQKFAMKDIHYLGSMSTERRKLAGKKGEFCLDISHYSGCCDYEFEYELYQEDDFQEAYLFLAENGFTYQESPSSKFARFLQTKNPQK